MKRLDIAGQRFGMLTAISRSTNVGGQSMWLCFCDCGAQCIKQLGNLRSGHTSSCGCSRSVTTAKEKTKHGMHGTPTYRSWQSMLVRCQNSANHKFPSYGGRGIYVCERWQSFDLFFSDMGERPQGKTLGRINNDGSYERANCEWQTAISQARNKRNTRLFLVGGIDATLQAHCDRLGLNSATVRSRIYAYKWPTEKAFSV